MASEVHLLRVDCDTGRSQSGALQQRYRNATRRFGEIQGEVAAEWQLARLVE